MGDIEGELPAAEERQEGLGGGEAGAVVVVAVFRRAHVGHEGGGEGREGKDRVSNLCLNLCPVALACKVCGLFV